MNCEEAEGLLAQLVYDELEGDTRDRLRAHVESCAACRELAGDMRVAAKLLKEGVELETPVLPPARKVKLFRQARRARWSIGADFRRFGSAARRLLGRRGFAAAAAALLVFALTVGLVMPVMMTAGAPSHKLARYAPSYLSPAECESGGADEMPIPAASTPAAPPPTAGPAPAPPAGGPARMRRGEFEARAGIGDAVEVLRDAVSTTRGTGVSAEDSAYTWRDGAGGAVREPFTRERFEHVFFGGLPYSRGKEGERSGPPTPPSGAAAMLIRPQWHHGTVSVKTLPKDYRPSGRVTKSKASPEEKALAAFDDGSKATGAAPAGYDGQITIAGMNFTDRNAAWNKAPAKAPAKAAIEATVRVHDARAFAGKVPSFAGPELRIANGRTVETRRGGVVRAKEALSFDGTDDIVKDVSRRLPAGATVEERGGKLVVAATPEAHARVDAYLKGRREEYAKLRAPATEPLPEPTITTAADMPARVWSDRTSPEDAAGAVHRGVSAPAKADIFGEGELRVVGAVSNYRPDVEPAGPAEPAGAAAPTGPVTGSRYRAKVGSTASDRRLAERVARKAKGAAVASSPTPRPPVMGKGSRVAGRRVVGKGGGLAMDDYYGGTNGAPVRGFSQTLTSEIVTQRKLRERESGVIAGLRAKQGQMYQRQFSGTLVTEDTIDGQIVVGQEDAISDIPLGGTGVGGGRGMGGGGVAGAPTRPYRRRYGNMRDLAKARVALRRDADMKELKAGVEAMRELPDALPAGTFGNRPSEIRRALQVKKDRLAKQNPDSSTVNGQVIGANVNAAYEYLAKGDKDKRFGEPREASVRTLEKAMRRLDSGTRDVDGDEAKGPARVVSRHADRRELEAAAEAMRKHGEHVDNADVYQDSGHVQRALKLHKELAAKNTRKATPGEAKKKLDGLARLETDRGRRRTVSKGGEDAWRARLSRESSVQGQQSLVDLGRLTRSGEELVRKADEARRAGDMDEAERLYAGAEERSKRAAEALKWMPYQTDVSGVQADVKRNLARAREGRRGIRDAEPHARRGKEGLELQGKLREAGIPYSQSGLYPGQVLETDRRYQHVERMHKIVLTQQKAVEIAKANMRNALGDKMRMENEVNNSRHRLVASQKEKARLEKDLQHSSWMIERMQATGEPVQDIVFGAVEGPEMPVNATVLAIRPEVNLVMVDAGSDQKLKKGHRLTVFRDDKYIGKVEVEKVFGNMASARVLSEWSKEKVNEGDDALTFGEGGGEEPEGAVPERSPRWREASKLLGVEESKPGGARRDERIALDERLREAGIAYSRGLVYGEDWKSISKRAKAEKLDRKVTFKFEDTPLREALRDIARQTGARIEIDPRVLAEATNTPITLHVKEMPARTTLKWILRLADLDCEIAGEGAKVSSAKLMAEDMADPFVELSAEEAAALEAEAKAETTPEIEDTQAPPEPEKPEEPKAPEESAEVAVPVEDLPPPPVNPFVLTARDRFSTFAMDVDTAAWTIARNHVRSGALPPRRSVRMEEFVNAFDYNYPTQARNVFNIHVDGAPAPFGRGLHLVKIGVQAKVLGREGRKPAHLVFVIDASGSMDRPDRLPLVKQSIGMLVGALGPRDRVSLVVFGAEERIVMEAVPATKRAEVLRAVDAIQAGGYTNMFEGLARGYEVAARQFRSGEINRVVLCSDGVANVGVADPTRMVELTEHFRRRGIELKTDDDAQGEGEAGERFVRCMVDTFRGQGVTLTTAGFGAGSYDDDMLERLANSGDGAYVFIDSPAEARRVFVEEMAATLQTVAKDAKIQVEFSPSRVRRYRLIGYENRDVADKDFRNDAVDAGEVGSGQAVTALYEVELERPSPRTADLGTVYVRYRNTDTGRVEEISTRIRSDILAPKAPSTSPRLYLAACAAETAEVLRGSEHARGGTLDSVERVMVAVANALPLDKKVAELLRVVHEAKALRGER
jgi:Ca-activated chloride channel family protein